MHCGIRIRGISPVAISVVCVVKKVRPPEGGARINPRGSPPIRFQVCRHTVYVVKTQFPVASGRPNCPPPLREGELSKCQANIFQFTFAQHIAFFSHRSAPGVAGHEIPVEIHLDALRKTQEPCSPVKPREAAQSYGGKNNPFPWRGQKPDQVVGTGKKHHKKPSGQFFLEKSYCLLKSRSQIMINSLEIKI